MGEQFPSCGNPCIDVLKVSGADYIMRNFVKVSGRRQDEGHVAEEAYEHRKSA